MSENHEQTTTSRILGIVIIIVTLYFLFIEIMQFSVKLQYYLWNVINYFDIASIVTNLMIVLNEMNERKYLSTGFPDHNIDHKTLVMALAFISMWIRAFYWMRNFGTTAFFIFLLK